MISRGQWPLCGVDEAGRGPLAGPVVAAAVIIEPESSIRSLVKDSKQLSATMRKFLYELIISSGEVIIGVAFEDPSTIDRVNILQATLKAMQKSFLQLTSIPVCALIDGNISPSLPCECIPVVRGDQSEPSISAASIVAKVTRDEYMLEMDKQYPGYGFARHKGYPTRAHYDAIRTLGPCPIHRRSFKGVVEINQDQR